MQDVAIPAALVITGDSTTAGADQSGAVSAATATGPLRHVSRPADPGFYLRWAPPALSNPTVVHLGATGSVNTAATGDINTGLDNTKDYIIVLPPLQRTETITLNGGRNIWVIGGAATLSGTQTDAVILITDNSTNGAATPTQGRVVHVEGVLMDGSGGLFHDGLDVDCPSAIVQVQNCRIVGMTGSSGTVHSDIIQNQGGCQELRVDHVTGSSDYQGFFWQPGNLGGGVTDILTAKVSNTNLFYSSGSQPGSTYLLWVMGPGTSGTDTLPYDFQNFWVANNRGGQTVQANSLWPGTISPSPGGFGVFDASTSTVTWPGTSLTGSVNCGTPPNGDFCPVGNCGIGYVSPGYYPAKQPGKGTVFVEEATTNLVRNPSFEVDLTDWSSTGSGTTTLTRLTSDSVSGSACMQISTDGTFTQQGATLPNTGLIAAVQGQTFTISLFAKGNIGNSAFILEFVERTSGGSFIASSSGSVVITPSPSAWTRYSFTWTVQNGTTAWLQARVRQTGSAGACVMLVDDVQVEQKQVATTYCDGSLGSGYSWSGTANASTSSRAAGRLNFASAGHIDPAKGSVAAWLYLPNLVPNGYVWSIGSYQTSSQDFIGLQVNSSGTGLQAVFTTGASTSTVTASNQFASGAWHFVVVSWKGTNVSVAVDQTQLTTGSRTTPAGSFNTGFEMGARTDGTLYADGYVGPLAVLKTPLTRRQASRLFARRQQFAIGMLPARLTPELVVV